MSITNFIHSHSFTSKRARSKSSSSSSSGFSQSFLLPPQLIILLFLIANITKMVATLPTTTAATPTAIGKDSVSGSIVSAVAPESIEVQQTFAAIAPDLYARLDEWRPNSLYYIASTLDRATMRNLSPAKSKNNNNNQPNNNNNQNIEISTNHIWIDARTHLEKQRIFAVKNQQQNFANYWHREFVVDFIVNDESESPNNSAANARIRHAQAIILKRTHDPVAYALRSFRFVA